MSSLVRMSDRVARSDHHLRFIKGHTVEFRPRGALTDESYRHMLVADRIFSVQPKHLVGIVTNPCPFTGTETVEVRWRGSLKVDYISANKLRRSVPSDRFTPVRLPNGTFGWWAFT